MIKQKEKTLMYSKGTDLKVKIVLQNEITSNNTFNPKNINIINHV